MEKIKNLLLTFIYKINKSNTLKYLMCFAFIFISTSVFATDGDDAKKSADLVNAIIWVFSLILWIWTNLVWMFLSPDWSTWGIFWLTPTLKSLWIIITNVVYIWFAFILVYIAIMNIVWSSNATVWLKQALPRFIVWILIVPFSWFFVQFIVSISVVLTTAVINIPSDLLWTNSAAWSQPIKYCANGYKINLTNKTADSKETSTEKTTTSTSTQTWQISTPIEVLGKSYTIVCSDSKDPVEKPLSSFLSSSPYWIMSYYTYNVMKIKDINIITSGWKWSAIANLFDVFFSMWFDFIFFIAYALIMLALLFTLITRWFYLWMYMVISPIFWLLYFFKKEKTWFKWMENLNISTFIWLAMIPVYVSAALVFWLLLISFTSVSTEFNNILKDWCFSVWWDESTKFCLSDEVKKDALAEVNKTADSKNATFWVLAWDVLIKIFWLVILWMWVMAALQSSKITKSVVDPIAWFGKSMSDLVKSIPKHTPILPWWMSLSWLDSAWKTIASVPQAKDQKRVNAMNAAINSKFWVSWYDENELNKIAEIKNRTTWFSSLEEMKTHAGKLVSWRNEYTVDNQTYKQYDKDFFDALMKSNNTQIKDLLKSLRITDVKNMTELQKAQVILWVVNSGDADVQSYYKNSWVKVESHYKNDSTESNISTPNTINIWNLNIDKNTKNIDNIKEKSTIVELKKLWNWNNENELEDLLKKQWFVNFKDLTKEIFKEIPSNPKP